MHFTNKVPISEAEPEVFKKKKCSQKFRKVCRKTPAPEPLLNKVAAATLLQKREHFFTKHLLATASEICT